MKSEIVYFTQLIDPIEFLIGKNEKDNFNIIDMSGLDQMIYGFICLIILHVM